MASTLDQKIQAAILEGTQEARSMPTSLVASKAPMSELEARPARKRAVLDQALAAARNGEFDKMRIVYAAADVEHAKRQLAYARATR